MLAERRNINNTELDLRYTQNFLRSPGFVDGLLAQTDIGGQDLVLDIGAGRGIITKSLERKVRHVVAIELDPQLAKGLEITFLGCPNVTVVHGDFLQWPLPEEQYKVFAAIPYNITTPIVTKLLNSENSPETAYLVMQQEAAERFVGIPAAEKDSQTSILLKPWFKMEAVRAIDRQQFTPVPSVDSTLVMFQKRYMSLIAPQLRQLFRDFVIYGYSRSDQRKSASLLHGSFRKVFSPRQRARLANEANIMHLRPTEITIDQWRVLFEGFLRYVSPDKAKRIHGAEQQLKNRQRRIQKSLKKDH